MLYITLKEELVLYEYDILFDPITFMLSVFEGRPLFTVTYVHINKKCIAVFVTYSQVFELRNGTWHKNIVNLQNGHRYVTNAPLMIFIK